MYVLYSLGSPILCSAPSGSPRRHKLNLRENFVRASRCTTGAITTCKDEMLRAWLPTVGAANARHKYAGPALRPARRWMTFEGNSQDIEGTDEERMAGLFGGRIRGEPPRSTSRMLVGETRVIAGVAVPSRPVEPDNCCMSGCVNCVWTLYNEDLRQWKQQRKLAAKAIRGTGLQWPADFDPPIRDLDEANIPESLRAQKQHLEHREPLKVAALFGARDAPLPKAVIEAKKRHLAARRKAAQRPSPDQEDTEGWDNVPVFIRVFAEFEKNKAREGRHPAKQTQA
ncbi:AGR214Cp [Eremothecium gossypii ATCC 10895]|uniref:AGR214Cp n=1 Tax=Eremothecium gossypii (strain ATCC 10895 / CBS 109.51 / FGSC 9923 / NRRL Y-1056) TaxID=284811 RepID=Q74ZI8_EREGS|nr:AGR214Cp [Eremothecium gossypii ATCC 10895]AAS54704.1 AGR214Cp [Eremothecium gossypii ATCC 10895]AEY99034.1 FAGR214Cp [Eremothecium gossypii FDAG1]